MVVDSDKYKIIGERDSTVTHFYIADLEELLGQANADHLELMMAKCFTSDFHVSGEEHNIAIAVNHDSLVLIDSKAALPCPPDCGAKRKPGIIVPFDEF